MAIKTLKNVKLKWCKFSVVDDYGKFSCQIDLNKDHAKQLKEWGLKVKKDDEGNLFIRVRRDEEKGPVIVKDASLNTVTAQIANGATANVMLDVYEYKKFGGGIAARLDKVQVIQWEPYGDDADFEPVDTTATGEDDTNGDTSGEEEERLF